MKKYRMMNRSDTLLHFAIKGKYSHYSLWANLRIMKYNAKVLKNIQRSKTCVIALLLLLFTILYGG